MEEEPLQGAESDPGLSNALLRQCGFILLFLPFFLFLDPEPDVKVHTQFRQPLS